MSKIESGNSNPSKRLIKQFCEIYDVNEDWLINGTGEKYASNVIVRSLYGDEAWDTATGYILRYIEIAEAFSPACNFNDGMWALIHVEKYLRLLNYVASVCVADALTATSPLGDSKAFNDLNEVLTALPGYRKFEREYWTSTTRDINLNKMKNKVWEDAKKLHIEYPPSAGRAREAIESEDRLLAHRVYIRTKVKDDEE